MNGDLTHKRQLQAVDDYDLSEYPTTRVLLTDLVLSNWLRVKGEDTKHVRPLAEVEDELPPIVVHRATMRVIDGMHRVRAAVLSGVAYIEALLFDGAEDEAFLLAVRLNVAHGLPLSRADRVAAAVRIIYSSPQWSDRAIARAAGLSDKTVASIRRRTSAEIPHLPDRIGRDGRVRPVSPAAGRRLASDLIAKNPDAAISEIATRAGISPVPQGTCGNACVTASTRSRRGTGTRADPSRPNPSRPNPGRAGSRQPDPSRG